MHTLFLNGPTGRESLNSLHTVPTFASFLDHIERFNTDHAAGEAINNFYKLPSLERSFLYLYVSAGFPTKATWRKIIGKGKYLTWPLITVEDVKKHFPD